ncbi:hypothetical protein [Leptospira yasudae]|uniref:hypothetical protein n=1 Tax=Leptospira yasudae TaxID=2202201 RepID=UPI00109171ED|nr:hypothetical protein [Leptospira yasudae]TGM99702.1 hypothetical protein EHR10_08920 [Leptospira yasudae]
MKLSKNILIIVILYFNLSCLLPRFYQESNFESYFLPLKDVYNSYVLIRVNEADENRKTYFYEFILHNVEFEGMTDERLDVRIRPIQYKMQELAYGSLEEIERKRVGSLNNLAISGCYSVFPFPIGSQHFTIRMNSLDKNHKLVKAFGLQYHTILKNSESLILNIDGSTHEFIGTVVKSSFKIKEILCE